MAVYVDEARNPFGRMVMCHMWADTAAELHAMAEAIGMKRRWFQALDGPQGCKASFPHYDVSLSRRSQAIDLGAVIVGRREGVDCRRAIRAHMIDDPGFAATWSWSA